MPIAFFENDTAYKQWFMGVKTKMFRVRKDGHIVKLDTREEEVWDVGNYEQCRCYYDRFIRAVKKDKSDYKTQLHYLNMLTDSVYRVVTTAEVDVSYFQTMQQNDLFLDVVTNLNVEVCAIHKELFAKVVKVEEPSGLNEDDLHLREAGSMITLLGMLKKRLLFEHGAIKTLSDTTKSLMEKKQETLSSSPSWKGGMIRGFVFGAIAGAGIMYPTNDTDVEEKTGDTEIEGKVGDTEVGEKTSALEILMKAGIIILSAIVGAVVCAGIGYFKDWATRWLVSNKDVHIAHDAHMLSCQALSKIHRGNPLEVLTEADIKDLEHGAPPSNVDLPKL